MEFTGVYHKTSEQMSYPLDEDRLIVNIKTGYDVKQVFIHYGDPYEAGILGGNEKWTGKREEIIYKKRLPHQIWWTTTLFPEYKRCKYYFELRTEKEVWYYFEDGFLTEEQLQQRLVQTWPEADEKMTEKLPIIYNVKEEYLAAVFETVKKTYGSMEKFFQTVFYLKPKMIEEFRNKYLI